MKKLNYILIIIAIIGIVFSFLCFTKEGYIISVNSDNKDLVSKSLYGEIENVDDITKVILGQGFHSGQLTIYHSSGKEETTNVSEGMTKLGVLEQYIRDNGYKLDNIGLALLGFSSLIIIYLLIYKYANKSKS